ncbi:MAG: class I mannose-6-phosphate isomerase, partial [Eubacteriales bacterium]|nr:class I mannose-6-phosphate isomerase [Eubacteriales bacterium]
RHGYPTGKNEAWVFLEAPDSGEIVYGQRTADEAALRALVKEERWNDVIARLKVEQGDFVYVPSGMLHALSTGCAAYEVQQATDVTYRFFDYHRRDAQGRERELHVEDAIDCVDFALGARNQSPAPQTVETPGAALTTYIQCPSFCIRRIAVHGEQRLRFPGYQLVTVAQGEGLANGRAIAKGASFLLPAGENVRLEGSLTLMTTCE